MIIYVETDVDGRLLRYANHPYHIGDGEIPVENTGVTPETTNDWIFKDGLLIHSPLPVVVETPIPTLEEVNAAKIDYIAMMVGVEL